ncbi:uncharacterized protein NECHADRAFT_83535 [Fusarium vanettenii 77-13-4]|uniref:Uncharacterized protein n=1 Tax=Fusarium vanettenii (strain ATCC MYA-4622 / CBS 123669 / FGSC 9596 / NRRL 45880 / 77-13-4) TaxID=660122 RepID=C7Z4A3_FUSV7|nr:uncharacterized protein NECHADRAFT_83535 [Fusarium vanettenii 77-13-4]EEU41279.1 hypothetical protein NECHADRAFT_83535 [Fusarium vanettenii 77-13-4]
MEVAHQEDPINQLLEHSNKRPIDRVLSTSPPQAIKRVCLEQDLQQEDHLMIHQPTPRSPTFSIVPFLESLTSSQPSQPIDRVGTWLETGYPFSRDEDARSDGFVQSFTAADPRIVHSAPATILIAPPSRPGSGLPHTPSSYGRGGPSGSSARNGTPSGDSTSGGRTGSLVENPLYEDLNLAANNIYYRDRREPLPQHVANLVQRVQRQRISPTPSISDILADDGLAALERGAGESTVEQYFQNNLVPQRPRNDPLKRSDKAPFQKHAVPNTGTQYRVSNPTPDVTSGYNLGAFTTAQKMQLGKTPNMSAMNNEGIWTLKQWKSCRRQEVRQIDSASFSIAMNGTEARLFISWKQQDLFNVQKVRSFALQEPDHFIEFRKGTEGYFEGSTPSRPTWVFSSAYQATEGLLETFQPTPFWQLKFLNLRTTAPFLTYVRDQDVIRQAQRPKSETSGMVRQQASRNRHNYREPPNPSQTYIAIASLLCPLYLWTMAAVLTKPERHGKDQGEQCSGGSLLVAKLVHLMLKGSAKGTPKDAN